MAELNKLQVQVFGRRVNYEPNTFIGGIGGSINTKELMAAKMDDGISANDIKNFQVDGNNNVSFYIKKEYYFLSSVFSSTVIGDVVTYFIDAGRKNVLDFNEVEFMQGQTGLKQVSNHISLANRAYESSGIEILHYYATLFSSGFLRNAASCRRVYLPNVITTSASQDSTRAFVGIKTNCKFYINKNWRSHPTLETNYEWVRDIRSGVLVEIDNYTPPSSITDLTISDITSTTAKVNFTPPSSVNGIDFYEIWSDDGTNDPQQLYLPRLQEITASGQIITGLKPLTQYKIKLATCDIYWNGSGNSDTPAFSNEVIFTTL